MAQRAVRGRKQDLIKKDRQGVVAVGREIKEETRDTAVAAQQRNRNRDSARGDWDRTDRRHDEGRSREETITASRADQAYPARARRRTSR
jgi:hypothetical protein